MGPEFRVIHSVGVPALDLQIACNMVLCIVKPQ